MEAENIKYLKTNSKLISYPKPLYEDYSASQKYPVAIALTQFHILLAYADTIKGVCLLNEEVVYEDNYNEAFGKLINVIKDIRTGKCKEIEILKNMFYYQFFEAEHNLYTVHCMQWMFPSVVNLF